jgi:BatD DUF11 like domain
MDIFAPIVAQAAAQQLMRLHVRTLTLAVEPNNVRVGDTLRLHITVKLDENVPQLDNLTLPDLSGFESLGDERRCTSSPRGTQCVEIMTLTPTEPGDRTIGPAELDAIDGRSARPTRFRSNTVNVHVAGVPQPNLFFASLVDGLLRPLLSLLLIGLVAFALLWWAGRLRRNAPRPVPVQPVVAPPAPPPQPPRLRALVATLAAQPTRPNVLAVRAELRRRVGASEDETLADLTARRAGVDQPDLRDSLRAIELAAFVDEARVVDAVGLALPPLERLAGSATAAV